MESIVGKFRYVKINAYHSNYVRLTSDEEFFKILASRENEAIFLLDKIEKMGYDEHEKESRRNTDFMVFVDGLMYIRDGFGYKTLEDRMEGDAKGFNGCCLKVRFRKGKIMVNEGEFWDESSSSYDGDVFYYAKSLGYNDFQDYLDAIKRGFGNLKIDERKKAAELGCNNMSEYEEYQQMEALMREAGFDSYKEYTEARSLGFDRQKYATYASIKKIKEKYAFSTFQETHLFLILNRKSLPREKDLSDIVDLLEKESPMDESRIRYGKPPEWYGKNMKSEKQIEAFLSGSKQLSGLGVYHTERKIFVSFSDHSLLVDGSNIAYINIGREQGAKPSAKNIELVVDKLKHDGFSEIKVFYDASLLNITEDRDCLAKLENEGIAKPVPAECDPIELMIKYAKDQGSFIVTNDELKAWSERDSWVRGNINRFRIALTIDNGVVKFTGQYEGMDLGSFRNLEDEDFDFKSLSSDTSRSQQ